MSGAKSGKPEGKKMRITDLGRFEKEMMTCTTCGYCKAVCPSFKEAGWESISPRSRVLLSYGLLEGEICPDDSVVEALAKCTTCADCVRKCPSKVQVVDIIECARKELYDNGFSPEGYRRIAQNIEKFSNPYGEKKGVAETLGEKVKPASIGFFLGCTSTYRHPEIARSKTGILDKLGIDYTLVDSVCCGSPLKRTGSGGSKLFERLVKANMERINRLGIKKLIFSCAGCYKTFKHDYPKSQVEAVHLTEYLNSMAPKLKPLKKKVAYHDPCHLGRGTNLYDPPRELLKKVPGLELVDLQYNRAESHCCGGGGGLRAAYPDMALQIAKKRMEEAKSTGAEILVTSCPFCVENLQQGEKLAKTGIKILDMTQLIDELME